MATKLRNDYVGPFFNEANRVIIIGINQRKRYAAMSTRFDPDLIAIIRCPVTKSPLSIAPTSLIDQLNQQIEAGILVNRNGQTVHIKLDGGFINEDQSLLLPVRGGIVILIADQAIGLNGVGI